ncbi:acyltransferase [Konateibacter massiliensis]|uniref:acyltransferase n=1 Tax=Konateibacter massiliensis TaxID=2002841 RepID=UPI001F1DC83C|nr:acyltransferase [Konateibacter massiliensis]
MQLELAWRAFVSLPKIVFWKIKYRHRLSISWVQALDKGFVLRISPKAKLVIGKELVTRTNVTLRAEEGSLNIGDKCFLNNGVSITCMEEVSIGDGCQIANHVVIVDHDHDYRNSLKGFTKEKVVIGKNVWIGANCVILKGSRIGDNSVIAAGSVVKGEVPADTLYYQKREAVCKKVREMR